MPDADENERRLQAFLALIRYAESGKQERSDAYTRLYGGAHFHGFSNHPRHKVTRWQHTTTAAGAYGITADTYDDAVKAHVVHDFSEPSQDAIATWRINHRGALWNIWDGRLDAAFTALNQTWSSLPGGGQQEITSEEAKRYVWNRLGEACP
ncbi:hypothetical protein [Lichenicoccus sp.]|uniref:hypothetical protein n=1 Tax=Lichenicoccus sp. TaxID=2781899 RepID=UPI003D104B4D